ncbi:MAG: hypothetical protein RLN76_08680 [Phycisphaeraceae bacterium]
MRGYKHFVLLMLVVLLSGCAGAGSPGVSREVPTDEELAAFNEQQSVIERQRLAVERQGSRAVGAVTVRDEEDWVPPPEVVWVDQVGERRATPAAGETVVRTAVFEPVSIETEPNSSIKRDQTASNDAPLSAHARPENTYESRQNPMLRALSDSARMVAEPNAAVSAEGLEGLSRQQRAQIERLRRVLLEAERQAAEDHLLDLDYLAHELRGAEDRPIEISRMEVCRSVSGYGVYEPLASRKLVAGREHPMIVYLELDGFKSEADSVAGMYQTRVTQEIRLYERRDGLMVWRQEPVVIVDTSRNRRRDFFVVQLIRLPANLTVGEYRLKARVKDELGQTLSEEMVDLSVVADAGLVERDPDLERVRSSGVGLGR